jgi:hypothetical protein
MAFYRQNFEEFQHKAERAIGQAEAMMQRDKAK